MRDFVYEAPLSDDEIVVVVQRVAASRPDVNVQIELEPLLVLFTQSERFADLTRPHPEAFRLQADGTWELDYPARLGWEQRELVPDLMAAAFAYFDGNYRLVPARRLRRARIEMRIADEELSWLASRKPHDMP